MSKTPEDFYYPDEAGPHERTFMQWPVSREVYQDRRFLDLVQQKIALIANTIAEFEPVVLMMDATHEAAARRLVGAKVEILDIPTDDLWCRDSGPIFVRDTAGRLAISHIQFNGWGGKQSHLNDGRVAERVSQVFGIPLRPTGLVGEGGGVEADGDGTLIAHESSWVNPNRNTAPKDVVEERLLNAMGAEKVIWAPGVSGADITDFHIDSLARFVRPGLAVIQLPEQPDAADAWSRASFETLQALEAAQDAKGRSIEIVTIPEPYDTRVAAPDFVASYVNYYVCNGAVIAAAFGDRAADARAEETLRRLHPDRDVVMLNVDALGELGGGVHCATQQQPKV